MMSNQAYITTLSVFFLFVILSSIKAAVYNLYVTDERKPAERLYKFIHTLAFTTLLYTGLGLQSRIVLALLYIIQLAYLNICISYFNFYHYYLHLLQGLKLLRESADIALRGNVPRNANQLLAFIDIPIVVYFFITYDKDAFLLKFAPCQGYILVSCLMLLLVMELIHLLRGKSLLQLIKTYPRSERLMVAAYGTLVNMLVDFFLFHRYDKITQQYDYGKRKIFKGTGSKRPNILILQMESLDANAVHLRHNGSYVMPFLHSLTEKSIYYPYMMNYHKAGGTSDAEFSIMSSVEPLSNFPSIKIPSYEHGNSFVRVLSGNAYTTAIFHGNRATYYRRDYAFSNMGYDRFYDMKEMNLKDVGWGAPDHEVFDFVLGKIEKEARPFFYYIITMSNHCRFTNALNYHHNAGFDGMNSREARNFYNSLSYVDDTLKAFVEKVRALDRETYVIILGDHTPGLKKSIYNEASITLEDRHLEFVPLFILTPDGTVYRENEKAASFLDIAPTVLALANIRTEYTTYGESLMPPNRAGEKIPYRHCFFDRKVLYREMEKGTAKP